jgi:hypothetical protein
MVACGLESHKLIPISSNTSFAKVDSLSAHENSKNEVNELIKKNEQFLDEFKNSIIQNQENNNHKILLKVNKAQETIFSKEGLTLGHLDT